MTLATFNARLHVLLAREAPLGLVIRRGPSKQVATLLWNRQHDEFELGQWFKGRIYERRCDLSPDGKLFLYFAMNGKWKSETGGAWTAISKAPYLKALSLFAKGDCWHGGGLWLNRTQYWLNDGCGHQVVRDDGLARRHKSYCPSPSFGGECPGVYYHRLMRDGWRHVEDRRVVKYKEAHLFDKPLALGWILRKQAHAELGAPPGKGCYWDEHTLLHPETSKVVACPDWEWAEIDGSRLVWCAKGCLWAGSLTDAGVSDARVLKDFNGMFFEAIQAPY